MERRVQWFGATRLNRCSRRPAAASQAYDHRSPAGKPDTGPHPCRLLHALRTRQLHDNDSCLKRGDDLVSERTVRDRLSDVPRAHVCRRRLEVEEYSPAVGEDTHAGRAVGERRVGGRKGPDDDGRFVQRTIWVGLVEAHSRPSTCAEAGVRKHRLGIDLSCSAARCPSTIQDRDLRTGNRKCQQRQQGETKKTHELPRRYRQLARLIELVNSE